MRAFYFDKSEHKGVFYIPGNLIMIIDKRDPDASDINYFPNNLQVFDRIWDSGNTLEKRRVLGDAFNCLELNIDNEVISRFQDYCWRKDLLGIANAHIFAKEMFESTKGVIDKYAN